MRSASNPKTMARGSVRIRPLKIIKRGVRLNMAALRRAIFSSKIFLATR